jgi:hypothetical protein
VPPNPIGDIGCDTPPNDIVVGDCVALKLVCETPPNTGFVCAGPKLLVGAGAGAGAESSISKRLLDLGAVGAGAAAEICATGAGVADALEKSPKSSLGYAIRLYAIFDSNDTHHPMTPLREQGQFESK